MPEVRLIDANALKAKIETKDAVLGGHDRIYICGIIDDAPTIDAEPVKWIPFSERLPEKAGEYLVAYHPCYWDDVQWNDTRVGIDTFRGKSTWAKKKFQRVTHWMPLPEPPESEVHDDADM